MVSPSLPHNAIDESPAPESLPRTASRPWQLWLVHLAWLLVVGLSVWVFAATGAARLAMLARLVSIHEPTIEGLGLSTSRVQNFLIGLDVLTFTSFTLVGLVVYLRRFRYPYGIFISAMMILLGVSMTRPFEIAAAATYWEITGLVLVTAFTSAAIIYFLFSFPDGRFIPGWLRWLCLGWVVFVLYWYLAPIASNPQDYYIHAMPLWAFLGWLGSGLLTVFYRYRHFTPTEQQQTKWVLYGTLIAGGGYLLHVYVIQLLFPAVLQASVARLMYETLSVLMLDLTMTVFPLTIAFSILRYRLWDIDLLIRRTLVYTLLTALLSGLFILLIALLQQIFYQRVGQPPVVVVALSTLAVSFLAAPLRQGAQKFVDRRFYRTRYQQAQLLEEVASALQRTVDLQDIGGQTLAVIRSTLHPRQSCLWLAPLPEGDLTVDLGEVFCSPPPENLQSQLEEGQRPVAVEDLLGHSVRQSVDGFSLVVPLFTQGELVGGLNLGPRRSGQAYSAQDRQMLSELARQVAPALRAAQLAQMQRQAALERQRMQTELDMGRQVQRTLLQQRLPDLQGWQVSSLYQPARALGGDFYDLTALPDGRIVLIIGDVSDKGIPASLVMASTRTLVRTIARRGATPGAVLQQANELMVGDIPQGMFVTCMVVLLDPASGRMVFANAGHNLPYLCQPEGVCSLEARGMPLGLLPGMDYPENQAQVEPGDLLLFYSDGLVEAHNPARQMYGGQRLGELLHRLRAVCPAIEALPGELIADLQDFTGPEHEQEDDITLLALRRPAAPGAST